MALGPAGGREVTRDTHEDAEAIRAAVEFRVDVARERDTLRVSPVGEVDVVTIAQLRERLDEALAADAGRVILDLRGVTFADSSALHLAVEANARAASNRIDFAIIAGPPAVHRMFEVAGLSAQLPFVDVPRA